MEGVKKKGTDGTNLCYIHILCDVYLYAILEEQIRLCYIRQDYHRDVRGEQLTSYPIRCSDNRGVNINGLLINLTKNLSCSTQCESC